jgi:hypothetical protein
MDVRLGIFVVPDATEPAATIDRMLAADRSGLDLAGVQDHPYQRRFFDTWTLLIGVPDEDGTDAIRRLGEEVAPRLRELVG